MNRFESVLSQHRVTLKRKPVRILQVNFGKLCNLACTHCHVEAGPTKIRENMDRETAAEVVRYFDRVNVETLDLTGGAPELNPNFRFLVTEARKRGIHVIDRCNLTVLLENGMEDVAAFLKTNEVEIVASLPCYSAENVDEQRGKGVFGDSVRALQQLNQLGYGKEGTGLILSLVYNPVGAHLPPSQAKLESDYRNKLRDEFGIEFTRLYCITNMPITRYAKYLKAHGAYDEYVGLLEYHFNPATVKGLMCSDTVSVGWDGRIYDCDFNQALGMNVRNGKILTIKDLAHADLDKIPISTANHCFGCTAGSGSSCQGVLTADSSL